MGALHSVGKQVHQLSRDLLLLLVSFGGIWFRGKVTPTKPALRLKCHALRVFSNIVSFSATAFVVIELRLAAVTTRRWGKAILKRL